MYIITITENEWVIKNYRVLQNELNVQLQIAKIAKNHQSELSFHFKISK